MAVIDEDLNIPKYIKLIIIHQFQAARGNVGAGGCRNLKCRQVNYIANAIIVDNFQ